MLTICARNSVLSMARCSYRTGAHARSIPGVRIIAQRFKVLLLQHVSNLFHLVFVEAALKQQAIELSLRATDTLERQDSVFGLISNLNGTLT